MEDHSRAAMRTKALRCLSMLIVLVITSANSHLHGQPHGDGTIWTDRAQLLEMVRTWQAAPNSHPAMDAVYARMPEPDKRTLVDGLIPSLSSSKWSERANAAYVLGLVGPRARSAIPALVASMDINMENVAWQVAKTLPKIDSREAARELAKALPEQAEHNLHEWRIMNCLAAIGPDAVDVVPYMVPFLKNGANTGAVKALSAIGPGAAPAICRGLQNADGNTGHNMSLYAAEVFNSMGNAASAPLVAALKSSTATGQRNLSVVFANIKPPTLSVQAAPGLCLMLKSEDRSIRDNAAKALIAIGPSAAPDVSEYANDADPAVAEAAQKILASYGPSAHIASSSLSRGIASSDIKMAAMSASTSLRIDPDNRAAIAKLHELIEDPNLTARLAAASAIGKAGESGWRLIPDLSQALIDRDSRVRLAAAEALGEIKEKAHTAVPALINAINSTHPVVITGREGMGYDHSIHKAAIESLGKIGPRAAQAVPLLREILLDDKRKYLKPSAYQTLEQMGKAASPAVPALIEILSGQSGNSAQETSEFVQNARVLKAIGRQAEPALPELRRRLSDNQSLVRRAAFDAVVSLEPNKSARRKDIEKMLNDRDYNLKEKAIKFICEDPDYARANSQTILELFDGDNYQFKMEALKGLGNIGPAAAPALPKLVKDNLRSSYQVKQRQLAFNAIKQIDPSGAKTIKLLGDALESPFKVRSAVDLLETIGSPECLTLAKSVRERWHIK